MWYISLLSCHTKYHRLGDLNNRKLFLTVLKAGSPSSRCQPIPCLVRALFLSCRQQPCHCVLTCWKESSGVSSSSYKVRSLGGLASHLYNLIEPLPLPHRQVWKEVWGYDQSIPHAVPLRVGGRAVWASEGWNIITSVLRYLCIYQVLSPA